MSQVDGAGIAALKGIAISSSFLTVGSLWTLSSITLPGIIANLENVTSSSAAVSAAKQFAVSDRVSKATQPPAELLTSVIFGFLAYYYRKNMLSQGSGPWKLYAGAAAAMLSIIPYTITLMEGDSQKLVKLSTAKPRPAVARERSNPTLAVPGGGAGSNALPSGVITPATEFEPYEDSPFSQAEYEQMKVAKILKRWHFNNSIRILAPLVSGVLGLWAALA